VSLRQKQLQQPTWYFPSECNGVRWRSLCGRRCVFDVVNEIPHTQEREKRESSSEGDDLLTRELLQKPFGHVACP
jgi:hypothetical protein